MNINGQVCCGCGACVAVCPVHCIELRENSQGFYQAFANLDACINCELCHSLCSMNEQARKEMKDPLAAYAAYSKKQKLRDQSSSGGLFTHIAEAILENHGVVYGASFDNKMHLKHTVAEKQSDLAPLRGSKYLQSDMTGVYQDIKGKLEHEIPVFFVGTPCQVAGLYSVLGERPDHLLTADLICHGTPAPGLFKGYLNFLEEKYKGKIIDYCFRSKERSNDRMSYTAKITLLNKQKTSSVFLDGNEEPYAMRFISNALQCESCFQCPYACPKRVGDLTLGDYWGYEEAHPELADVAGVSLLLVNTPHGQRILDLLDDVALIKTHQNSYLKKNKHLSTPPPKHPDRERIYAAFEKEGFTKSFYKTFFLPDGYYLYLLKRKVRRIIR